MGLENSPHDRRSIRIIGSGRLPAEWITPAYLTQPYSMTVYSNSRIYYSYIGLIVLEVHTADYNSKFSEKRKSSEFKTF